jgi:hypothetical protein
MAPVIPNYSGFRVLMRPEKHVADLVSQGVAAHKLRRLLHPQCSRRDSSVNTVTFRPALADG